MDSFWRRRSSGQEDATFVAACYQDLLGRPPDEDALASALEGLRRGRLNRRRLQQLLVQSEEHQAYVRLCRLYQQHLERPPTAEERWQGLQLLQERSQEALERVLQESLEYQFRVTPPPPPQAPYAAKGPPREVWLELTTHCNMRPPCIMCGKAALPEGTPSHHMDPQLWQGLLPILRQADGVGLHGGGEPLLYPHLFDLLAQLDPHRTQVGFNSNGHLLSEKTCRRLIEHQLTWISVSVDAASPEMYLRLRRSERFSQVLDNIRRLEQLKAELGSRRPRVDINMTVMCTNLPEVVPFVELAGELGLPKVTLQQIIPGGNWALQAPDGYLFDYAREELHHCLPQHAEVMGRAWPRAQALGLILEYEIAYAGTRPDWPQQFLPMPPARGPARPAAHPERPPLPAAFCDDPWTTLMVYADGRATFCCYHYPESVLGNLSEQSLEDVWNGPRARTIRRWVLEQERPLCCEGCFKVCD